MKAGSEVSEEQFRERLLLQGSTSVAGGGAVALYKLAIRPYEYYIEHCFEGPLAQLQFYQEVGACSALLVGVERAAVGAASGSCLERWLGLAESGRFSMSCFLKYYNYTLRDWIDQQRTCNSRISEEEVLMVLRHLLAFQRNYALAYRQPAHVFRAELIFVTPEKSLRVYPHSIPYSGQVAASRDQSYLVCSQAKLDKRGSVETTINNSQAVIEQTHEGESESGQEGLGGDMRDIYLLAVQLVSLRRYEHFFSARHGMVIWDAVCSELNSHSAAHLSAQFLDLLRGVALTRSWDCEEALGEVERLIALKDRMCKTIHVERNSRLADQVLTRLESEKSRNLQELRFLKQPSQQPAQNPQEDPLRPARRFHSY